MDDYDQLPEAQALSKTIRDLETSLDEKLLELGKHIKEEKRKLKQLLYDEQQKLKEIYMPQITTSKQAYDEGRDSFCLIGQFEGFEQTGKDDLEKLTLSQLIFLGFKVHGYDHDNSISVSYSAPLLKRKYSSYDSWQLSDSQFKDKIIQFLKRNSCSMCGNVFHKLLSCPKYLIKKCIACSGLGHYVSECDDLVRLRYLVLKQQEEIDKMYEPGNVGAKEAKSNFEQLQQ